MEPIKIIVEILVHTTGTIEKSVRVEEPLTPKGVVEIPTEVKIEKILIHCHRFFEKIGKKPERSCKGCTVQCQVKGMYEEKTPYGWIIEIEPKKK